MIPWWKDLKNQRENSDEKVEQHDVADKEVDGEEEGDDVVVVSQVLDVRLEAVAPTDMDWIIQQSKFIRLYLSLYFSQVSIKLWLFN